MGKWWDLIESLLELYEKEDSLQNLMKLLKSNWNEREKKKTYGIRLRIPICVVGVLGRWFPFLSFSCRYKLVKETFPTILTQENDSLIS
jgi:hypothetical protein